MLAVALCEIGDVIAEDDKKNLKDFCLSEAGHGMHAAEIHSVPLSQIQVCAMCVSQNQNVALSV